MIQFRPYIDCMTIDDMETFYPQRFMNDTDSTYTSKEESGLLDCGLPPACLKIKRLTGMKKKCKKVKIPEAYTDRECRNIPTPSTCYERKCAFGICKDVPYPCMKNKEVCVNVPKTRMIDKEICADVPYVKNEHNEECIKRWTAFNTCRKGNGEEIIDEPILDNMTELEKVKEQKKLRDEGVLPEERTLTPVQSDNIKRILKLVLILVVIAIIIYFVKKKYWK